ncbi:hypothetical protein [Singulisphaera sp. GP187]|uniref:hypothetical protein n=1 Tax=Singulisphaera sp. GP187 TaxID=1882752 RepID=UPI0020B12C8A|nr:hypothetical protein [Singulisphaera sp. GP187]
MAKKKKVRVAFKKNRQNRTRANDLTRRYRQDDLARAEPVSAERVRAKGDLSRHRTIVTDVTGAGEPKPGEPGASEPSANRSVDLSACLAGRVIRVHGLLSMVEDDDGRIWACHIRRILKTLAIDGRNVIAVGDRVWFRPGTPRAKRG